MNRVSKTVKTFCRASDMLFAELRDERRFTDDELNLVRNYALRLQSLLVLQDSRSLRDGDKKLSREVEPTGDGTQG